MWRFEATYRFAIRSRSWAITRSISALAGSDALPSIRSATHSDWASASGMIGPSGCSSPMK